MSNTATEPTTDAPVETDVDAATEPATTQETTTAPAAPAAAPAAATEAGKTFTQAEVDAIVNARLERASKQSKQTEKTLEERLADIETKAVAAEKAAVNAIIAKAAAAAHDSAIVAKLVDLGELTSADASAIEAKVTEFLTANPYLLKTGTATPAVPASVTVAPTPGAGGVGSVPADASSEYLSDETFETVTSAELAADENLMKRYLATAALKG